MVNKDNFLIGTTGTFYNIAAPIIVPDLIIGLDNYWFTAKGLYRRSKKWYEAGANMFFHSSSMNPDAEDSLTGYIPWNKLIFRLTLTNPNIVKLRNSLETDDTFKLLDVIKIACKLLKHATAYDDQSIGTQEQEFWLTEQGFLAWRDDLRATKPTLLGQLFLKEFEYVGTT